MNLKDNSQELSNYYLHKFTHIYVENDVKNNENTIKILNNFKKSTVIYIDNYKDVFNRPRQNFNIQKNAQNLIIAEKRGQVLYKGSYLCENFNERNFYYCSNILNCMFNCEYCYLKGIYTSSNIVMFVNTEDFFREIKNISSKEKMYLCISYDSDLLSFENLTGFVSQYIDFACKNPNVLIELKTKSSNFKSIMHKKIPDNFILAYTLSPNEVIAEYEKDTPDLHARIDAAKMAVSLGVKIRISIEPVMKINNFEKVYSDFIKTVFDNFKDENIRDLNLGTFRISDEHMKNIRKHDKYSNIFAYNLVKNDGFITYENSDYMEQFVCGEVKKYIDASKIFKY